MEIIQDEGSFEINNIEVHEQMSGVDKGMQTPKIRAFAARAAFEPTIIQHFGRPEGVMDEFVGTIERQLSHVPASPAGSLLFLCVFDGNGILIFRQVMIAFVLVEHNASIWLQIQRPESYSLSTTTPQVINHVTKPVDLAKKANPCLRNEEHKQELERT